jgi:hypothetical protein
MCPKQKDKNPHALSPLLLHSRVLIYSFFMAEDFRLILGREGNRTFMRLQGQKGMRRIPDFRRYTGLKRELLREFLGLKRALVVSEVIGFDTAEDEYTLFDPAEMDETGKTLSLAEVIFPKEPEAEFRQFLTKGKGRGRRSSAIDTFYEENGRFIIAPDFARTFISENIILDPWWNSAAEGGLVVVPAKKKKHGIAVFERD